MAKSRITVTIDPDIKEWLEAASKCYGRSSSEIIRICLREFHDIKPNRFATADKARTERPESWHVIRENLQNS